MKVDTLAMEDGSSWIGLTVICVDVEWRIWRLEEDRGEMVAEVCAFLVRSDGERKAEMVVSE